MMPSVVMIVLKITVDKLIDKLGERDNLLRKKCYTTFCYRKFVTATFCYSDNLLRDNLLHDILLHV